LIINGSFIIFTLVAIFAFIAVVIIRRGHRTISHLGIVIACLDCTGFIPDFDTLKKG
jgi:hypothetical protein